MNKKIKIVIAVTSVFIAVLAAVFVAKPKEQLEPLTSFITADTELLVYENFLVQNESGITEAGKEKLGELQEIYKDIYNEDELEKMEKLNKTIIDITENVNDMILLSETIQYESVKTIADIKAVLIADFKSSFADLYLKKYFTQEGDLLVLKDDKAETKLIEDIIEMRKEMLSPEQIGSLKEFLKPMEISAKKVGGRYVFSLNKEFLNEYASKISAENNNNPMTKKFLDLNDGKKLTLTLVDANKISERYKELVNFKNYVDNLDYITMYSNYNSGELTFNFDINGAGKIFSLIDSSGLEERKLKEYINDKFAFYLANNSFENLAKEINSEVVRLYGLDYAQFAGMMLGGEPYTMINNLGDELVINMNKVKTGIVLNTKDSQMVTDFLTKIGLPYENGIYSMNQMTLELKDDRLFFNQEAKTYTNEIDFKNLALYSKLDLEFIVNNYYQLSELGKMGIDYFTPELFLYTEKDKLSLKVKTDYQELMDYIISTTKATDKLTN